MNKQKNLEKLIFDIFDKEIEGTDIYNHEGSMWLIFTEERKWVVEFTKQKTLWYNYKHFNDILMLFGMELNEGAEYIKKWYEDKFIFNVVKNDEAWLSHTIVDNVIDNGVKETDKSHSNYRLCVDNAIQNGMKNTRRRRWQLPESVEDTIQSGVNSTSGSRRFRESLVKDTIQNGVKNIIDAGPDQTVCVEDTIQNGVKKISYHLKGSWSEYITYTSRVKDTIQNGVKEIIDGLYRPVEDTIQNGVKNILSAEYNEDLDKTIQNGVINTIPTYNELENVVEDTIQNGVKEVEYYDGDAEVLVNEAIENGVKYMMSGSEFKNNQVEDIIKYSEKL